MSARELIAREQAKCEAASPGPWVHCKHLRSKEDDADCPCGYRGGVWSGPADVILFEMGGSPDQEGFKITPEASRAGQLADAAFIASARAGYPAALKALDAIAALCGQHSGNQNKPITMGIWTARTQCACEYCEILAAFRAAIAPEGEQKA